jgi:hypothetical protein
MERQSVLVALWMVGALAVGAAAYSPIDGATLSLFTTFALFAVLEIRGIYEW